MKNNFIMIVFFSLFSCAPKFYMKEDYTFYDKNFRLEKDALLRTDGIYILESVWTKDSGHRKPKKNENRFYKFYETGQSNLILDIEDNLETEKDYIQKMKNETAKGKEDKKTLFQGYYKLKGNKISIQNRVVPRRQFNYSYGYLEENKLVIVSKTHEGKGDFDEKHFTDYYKETYYFLPISATEREKFQPYW